MPRPTTLTRAQARRVTALSPHIRRVYHDGISGASPFVRVQYDHELAALKFYDSPNIYATELAALRALDGSKFVPRLLDHGRAAPAIQLPGAGDNNLRYGYWICRAWITCGDALRLPLVQPARFAEQLTTFVDDCSAAGLVMGDAKRTNFLWNGEQLIWLDYGWFSLHAPEQAVTRNEIFRALLLRRLGW